MAPAICYNACRERVSAVDEGGGILDLAEAVCGLALGVMVLLYDACEQLPARDLCEGSALTTFGQDNKLPAPSLCTTFSSIRTLYQRRSEKKYRKSRKGRSLLS